MKRNILMVAIVAALFTSSTFAQTTPAATPTKAAKMEKKAHKAKIETAQNEDKKIAKVDKKDKKMAHKKAKHTKES